MRPRTEDAIAYFNVDRLLALHMIMEPANKSSVFSADYRTAICGVRQLGIVDAPVRSKGWPICWSMRRGGESHQLKSLDQESGVGRHVGRAVGLMRTQLAEKSTTEQLAAIIGISRRQLDRLFHQQFAQSTHEYWHEMRIQHLRWRLLNSHHNLASLADEMAFKTAVTFVGYFVKDSGRVPIACVNNNRIPAQ